MKRFVKKKRLKSGANKITESGTRGRVGVWCKNSERCAVRRAQECEGGIAGACVCWGLGAWAERKRAGGGAGVAGGGGVSSSLTVAWACRLQIQVRGSLSWGQFSGT